MAHGNALVPRVADTLQKINTRNIANTAAEVFRKLPNATSVALW
jgi:hypothetical protein